MRDLAEIKRINSAANVGDKLGANNGNPMALGAQRRQAKRLVEGQTYFGGKGPMNDPDPVDGWENPEYSDYEAFRERLLDDAGRVHGDDTGLPGDDTGEFSRVLEKVIL